MTEEILEGVRMEHYYSKEPSSKSEPVTWKERLRGYEFVFTSDHGVFSKGKVDFGSKTLIEQFQEPEIDGPVLDAGCGYGPIGISLAKAYSSRHVYMVDVNQRALELAEKNAADNDIRNVTIMESDLFTGLTGEKFAAIVSNPPVRAGKKVVHRLLEDSYQALLPGGELWIVLQKKQGAPSAQKKLDEIFGHADIRKRNKGYYIIVAKKFDSDS